MGRACKDHAAAIHFQGISLDTPAGRQEAAWLTSALEGPVGAFLSALPCGALTLGDEMCIVAAWHRLRFRVPTGVSPPPCIISVGVAPYHTI